MFGLLLAVAIATPNPVPSAPPQIYRMSVSPSCKTLSNVMLPVGYVTRRDDAAFRAAARSMANILNNFMPGDVPTVADIDAALGTGPNTGINNINANNDPRVAGANGVGTGTAASAELSDSSGDDPLMYGPKQILDASHVDMAVQHIISNIQLERGYIRKSLALYPPHADPRVDELRHKTEELIVLQQALAARYDNFAGTYIDNIGMADMIRNSPGQLDQFKLTLRGLLLGDTSGLTHAEARRMREPNFGYANVEQLATMGSNGELVQALGQHEFAFTKALISQYNQCHGTHYVLTTKPHPAPASPSPKP